MMTKIIKIGNSRGIRIPNLILKESGIENDVELRLSEGNLIIRPVLKNNLSVNEPMLLSEKALAKDWNNVAENEAWSGL